MNLYLDTEFDSHGGDLISLALAADDGKNWYGVWPVAYGGCRDPRVLENVIPHIGVVGGGYVTTVLMGEHPDVLRASLKEYLKAREGYTIWADWPDDFAHLMRLMSGPSYADSFMIPCTMQLIVTPDGEPKPEIPHNALSDAIALMRWHQASEGKP